MYQFDKYVMNKGELLKSMESTKEKILELETFGIDVSESIRKIENAKGIVQNDKISIVLVGAFSDGKTSVAAGWLNEKMDNMKIDSDESSDEILCYTPSSIPNGCQIVDTPGLFGDKVGMDENGGRIALSEKTKKYISEANVILYVVTAKNPIKDSHKDCIRWILMDLNKLSSTIFVINRMDDVADMTDSEDYEMQARIKSDNLRTKLVDCGLTDSEIQKVKIACISAAPDGRGIEAWQGYREEYLKRSRLTVLENITNEILQHSREHLIAKTGCDILNSEIKKMIEIIREQEKLIETVILPEQKESLDRNKKDLQQLQKRLLRSRGEIKDELRNLEKAKISAIRAATIDDFNEVLEDEIGLLPGQEGYRLNDEINDILERYCEKHSEWTNQVGTSVQAEYDKHNELMESLMSKGTDAVAKGLKSAKYVGVDVFKKGIFAGRDLLGKMGKTVKFKPWQVTKMASFATKALPIIGAVIEIGADVITNTKEQKKNRKFEDAKDQLKDQIMGMFREINEQLNNNDRYFADFAPDYNELVAQIEKDAVAISEQERLLKEYKRWDKQVADSDFSFC